MGNKVIHKGWDWNSVSNEAWDSVSAEFLAISFDWLKKFSSMVDIGAGKGRHALYMNANGMSVSAVDLSETSKEIIDQKNQEQGGTVKSYVADMTDLPFEDESFGLCNLFSCYLSFGLSGNEKGYWRDSKGTEKGRRSICYF